MEILSSPQTFIKECSFDFKMMKILKNGVTASDISKVMMLDSLCEERYGVSIFFLPSRFLKMLTEEDMDLEEILDRIRD